MRRLLALPVAAAAPAPGGNASAARLTVSGRISVLARSVQPGF